MFLCACFIFGISASSFSQSNVSVSDFRYPETQALDWKGSLHGSFGTSDYGFGDPFGESTSNSVSGDFSLSSSALFFHSQENHDNLIHLTAFFGYQQSKHTNDGQNEYSTPETKSYSKRGSITGSWEYKHYLFTDEPLHLIGSASLAYYGSFDKDNRRERINSVVSSSEEVRKSYNLSENGFLGIGYGRMREGTFVIRALRILERLQEDGVITETLSREQTLALVDRVAHTREYTTNLERYEKYLVYDIVTELVDDGIILPEVGGPFSILKITEVLREQIEPRFFGWRAYYAFGGRDKQMLDERTTNSTYYGQGFTQHDFLRDGAFIHRIAAEFGYPVSQWTHINAEAKVDIPHRVSSKFFTSTFAAKVIHQIGERIDVVGGYQFRRSAGNDFNSGDDRYYRRYISHHFDATFRFFIEDQLSLNTSLLFSREFQNLYDAIPFPDNSNSSQNSSGFRFSFGINYNII
jgi:hypothetical protein